MKLIPFILIMFGLGSGIIREVCGTELLRGVTFFETKEKMWRPIAWLVPPIFKRYQMQLLATHGPREAFECHSSVSPYCLKFWIDDAFPFGFNSLRPRKLRVEYPGAIYHVMNRGDQREDIFRDDQDRRRLLATVGEVCEKTGWQVHAYCLMNNHFHLIIETPEANLVFGMKWLLGTYTKRFNIRHKLCGHLFAGRYKALSDGTSARRGGGSRLSSAPPGLVFGQRAISATFAGLVRRARRVESLWRRPPTNQSGKSPAHHRRRIGPIGLGSGRIRSPAQERRQQSSHRATFAAGDHHEPKVGSGKPQDGYLDDGSEPAWRDEYPRPTLKSKD